jgi:hypothetical protein
MDLNNYLSNLFNNKNIQEPPHKSEITQKNKMLPKQESIIVKPVKHIIPKNKMLPKQESIIVKPVEQITQRRRPLPASVRDSVWNHYIGEDINKHRCLCCKKVLITNRQFQVGHVISVRDGGTDEISNLRPICSPCNHSMGTKNMIEFIKSYGYYAG